MTDFPTHSSFRKRNNNFLIVRYNMENLTSKKNTNYQGWELGKTFEALGLDGNQHQVRTWECYETNFYNCWNNWKPKHIMFKPRVRRIPALWLNILKPFFQITFDFKDEVLSEHHIRLNEPETSAETYFYTIDDQNQLVMKMENNGIVCRRWFKKVEQKWSELSCFLKNVIAIVLS